MYRSESNPSTKCSETSGFFIVPPWSGCCDCGRAPEAQVSRRARNTLLLMLMLNERNARLSHSRFYAASDFFCQTR